MQQTFDMYDKFVLELERRGYDSCPVPYVVDSSMPTVQASMGIPICGGFVIHARNVDALFVEPPSLFTTTTRTLAGGGGSEGEGFRTEREAAAKKVSGASKGRASQIFFFSVAPSCPL